MPITMIILRSLAQSWVEQGDLYQALDIYHQALELLEAAAETEHARLISGRIYIGLAELAYQWNDLEGANQHLQTGLKLGEVEQGSASQIDGYLALARLRQAQGDPDGALEAVRRAAHLVQRYGNPYYWANEVAAYQAQLWLAQGNLRSVEHWARQRGLWPPHLPEAIPFLREGEYLILARLLLAQSSSHQSEQSPQPEEKPPELAQKMAAQITQTAQQAGRLGRMLEALALQALIFQAQDNIKQALLVLEEALSLAEPEGYIRLFIDEGPAMADLLQRAANQNLFPAYTKKLLADFKATSLQSAHLLDPLSERELEILSLIAGGMSNKDLAESLFLTVGTVKWHLNNIYSKLDVRSRTQAVARARELGLI
jgi:LuxR family maltose regulon positive regulatory protein